MMAATIIVAWPEAWWSLVTWQGSRQASEGGQCCVQPQESSGSLKSSVKGTLPDWLCPQHPALLLSGSEAQL